MDGPAVSPPVVSKGTVTKSFVLDTNVLLHNSASLFMFDDNEVVIPFVVLEELDKFKKSNDDVGRNARQVIRHLDGLREKGSLVEGVQWNGHKGTIRVEFAQADRPRALHEETPDNRIIAVAYNLKEAGK
ncbi:MAG: PIN domain-containing protein, partial [Phycisphaeraceae bacterium JB051]